MSRPKGARRPCGVREARQRLIDARQFFEAAELLDAVDVVATNAIHAAIAAADAVTCSALGERSSNGKSLARRMCLGWRGSCRNEGRSGRNGRGAWRIRRP